jgi:hypothetical protein
LAFVAICVAGVAIAQTERGSITGVVTDPQGAAISGASVAVIQTATNTTSHVTTSAAGEYTATNLLPGSYRVEVSSPGFKRSVHDSVVVTAGATVRLDPQLQLGQVSEVVEVLASAAQIQTENAKVSTVVGNKLVDELPLVVGGAMRSPFNLVSITAESKGRGQTMGLGGGQVAAWDATLDGHSVGTNRSGDTEEAALNTPSVEALTEFTVDTNGFKAEYGQSGGGIMTFVSKSGTNKLHGSAYDFLRNDKMDSRGFFAATRAVYRQNDFGVTLGGPVVLPKLYNGRDKTFFFASWEGFRNRVGANDAFRSIPTPEMYQGDFSKWVDARGAVLTIYDPATTRPNPAGTGYIRDPFPNNQIPTNRFSALSRQMMQFGQPLKPNRPTAIPGTVGYVANNYVSTGGTETTPTDKWSVKGDQMIGTNQRVSFLYNGTRFRRQPGANGPPGLPIPLWDGQIQAWDTRAYRMTHDWTLSANLVNHFSIAGNTFIKNSYSGNSGGNWKDKICMKNVVDCNDNLLNVRFTEFSNWGGTSYNGTEQPGWGIKDDLSYVRGKHTWKFGYQFQDQRANGFGQQDIAGQAMFSFLSTSVPGITTLTSGNSFASFLLGDTYFGRTETIRAVTQYYRYNGFYVQDDWRVSRKLILNLGLRYDFTIPPISATDEYSDFTPDRPNPGADGFPGALRFAGTGPGREGVRSLVPGWYGGIGPRIGIAYSPDQKTTFRTGFGRSFSRVTAVQGSGHFAGFIGQYEFPNTSLGVTPTFNWDDGLPPYKLPPAIDPAFSNGNTIDWWQGQQATRAPENLYWTFSIQRQVTGNTVVEIAYNGNVGTHMQSQLVRYNQVPTSIFNDLVARFGPQQAITLMNSDILSPQARAANIPIPYPSFVNQRARTVSQALRPYPQYLDISTGPQNGDKSGHSSYHAMVLKADRRFASGLAFQWNYTLSKLITDSDTYFANSATAAMDHYNRRLEKSIGQFDQTHSVKFATLYELPFGKGRRWLSSGFLSQVLGGWRVTGSQIYSTGFPVALSRNNPLPLFNAQTRPVIDSYDNWRPPLQGDKFDPAVDRFLKPSNQFPAQPAYLMGNATRYNPKVRAFPYYNENVSLAKTFSITESVRIDIRGEAFNVLNRTVFLVSAPNTNLNSNQFGVVTGQSNDPRQMQVALKIYW